MRKNIIYLLLSCLVFMNACQKEKSYEASRDASVGTLQDDGTGDCLPKTVNGAYIAATPLVPATNTISIQVNVTTPGAYTIYTDTVNGYYFRATGVFITTGINSLTLKGNGTPFTAGNNNFLVTYDSSSCNIAVTVLPAGSGPANFTLGGAPNSCTNAVVSGSYATGIPLNFTNTVAIDVNVTALGTYTVNASYQGMTFSKTGAFTVLGVQTVILNGSGAPLVSGANTVPVTITGGASSCSFVVNVGASATGTLGTGAGACTPATISGTYTAGVVLTTSNTVQIQANITTAGVFSISTNTVDGFSFAASGNIPVGPQLITLNGNGTPLPATPPGPQTFTVTFGTNTCTFVINVVAGANGAYTPNCSSAVVNGTYTSGTALTAANTVTMPVNVTAIGPYNITTTAVNGMTFSSSGTFTGTGNTTITLVGSGTPGATATTSNITMPGTTACTFPVTVVAGTTTVDWKFTVGATTYQGYTASNGVTFDGTTAPPITLLDYNGVDAAAEDFSFSLLDVAGGINGTEQYNSTSPGTTNAAAFYFTGTTIDLTADPSTPSVTMIIKITSHNIATKTIIGTFSGTALDAISSTTKTVTNGTFTAVYP